MEKGKEFVISVLDSNIMEDFNGKKYGGERLLFMTRKSPRKKD